MAQTGSHVNPEAGLFKDRWQRFRDWIDCHPRTGWYVAVMVTLDFLLHLMQAVG